MTQKIAFVFPGQGSQSVGMLGELAGEYPSVRQTFEEASDHSVSTSGTWSRKVPSRT
jgi:malonyl CoA-acyl carrier protein transacylase